MAKGNSTRYAAARKITQKVRKDQRSAPSRTSNVSTHPRFSTSPIVNKRRRGAYPAGVVSIRSVARLRVGAVAEVVDSNINENNGAHVLITDYDGHSKWCWGVRALDRDLECTDGTRHRSHIYFRCKNLRRVWTGLTRDEFAKWRL